jgi:polysaccharide export outer membrane protein
MTTPGIGPEQFITQQRTDGINIGDQVQLTVLGYPEFNTTGYIRESGTFPVPLAGEVHALGLTKEQLTEQIIAKISEYVKTKVYVTVNVTTTTVKRIIVLGAVGTQGSQPAAGSIPIFQLFANVGGLTADADLRHVRVYRNTDLTRPVEVDLSSFASPGSRTDVNIPMVNPGDMVYVPRSENFMREFSPFIYDILVLLTLFRLIN